MVDTTDEWIRSRTGIERRHVAADGETTVDLAEKAARRALDAAGVAPAASDRKSTRPNSSHRTNSYAVFCLKKKYTFTFPPLNHPLRPSAHLTRAKVVTCLMRLSL